MSKKTETMIPRHLFAVHLRALVLALGEKSIPAWWKTEFMSEAGLRFLERLYPRSPVRAAVHAAGKAACDAHDKAVGRVSVYHLFRLPESLEVEIHSLPSFENDQFVSRLRSSLGCREELLEMLSTLCSNQEPTTNVAGPKRIGAETDVIKVEALIKAAAVYRDAFNQGKPAFPYFAA